MTIDTSPRRPIPARLKRLAAALLLVLIGWGGNAPRAAGQVSSAAINSLSARVDLFGDGCLYSFARVEVQDASGAPVLGLGRADFAVREDAGLGYKAPLDYFVIPPDAGTATRAVDFLFVMDNSLSMGDEQDAIRDNLIAFIDALRQSGIDYQLGLTRYGQKADDGVPIITNNGALTRDAIFFRDNIWALNTTQGSIEPGYHGVQAGLQGFNLRPDAQTVVILISDEMLEQGSVPQSAAIEALQAADATFYGLVPLGVFYTEQAQALADTTGGRIFDITSNFNDVLNTISQEVSGVYTVGYRPADPFAETGPVARDVEITVAGGSATATGQYAPGSRPAMRRTEATATLRHAPAGSALTLTAQVADLVAPDVTGGALFYRPTGSTAPYASVPLTLLSDGRVEAAVPASAVQAPGLDYFFRVTDGENTVTAPGVAPATTPFQTGVGTNDAPAIAHTAPASFTPGSPVTISAEVTDANLETVTLYYRTQGRIGYKAMALFDLGGGVFEGTIPPMDVTDAGLDYYLRAVDADSVASLYGTPEQPVVLGGCAASVGADKGQCTLAQLTDEQIHLNTSEGDYIDITIKDADDGIQGIGFVQQANPDDPTPDPLNPDDWAPALINATAELTGSTGGTFVDAATLADAPTDVLNNPGIVWIDSDLDAPHPTAASFRITRTSGSRFGYFAAVLNGCGGVTYVDPVYDTKDAPSAKQVRLNRNYPNPAAGATIIPYELPEAMMVTLTVYDIMGRKVATLVDQPMPAGAHEARWDGTATSGRPLASGVYFYRLEADGVVETRRMVVVR